MKFELWRSPNGHDFTFCKENQNVAAFIEDGSDLIWTVDAKSHFEAMTFYYQYMGLGEYKSDSIEEDTITYKELGLE